MSFVSRLQLSTDGSDVPLAVLIVVHNSSNKVITQYKGFSQEMDNANDLSSERIF